MENIIIWASAGVLVLFLLIGMLCGLVRGLKRSSLHLLFVIGSIVLAFFITKPVVNAVLGITVNSNGEICTLSELIIKLISESFDISQFGTASTFIVQLPAAIVSPILFILLSFACYFLLDIIYLIFARVTFGSKKKDFANKKPHRLSGGVIGMLEAFLFLVVIFAPLTALTNTFEEISYVAPAAPAQVQTLAEGTENKGLQTIPEIISGAVPKEVSEALYTYNKSIIGKIAGAGGLDGALFDGLSNFDINGQKINFRTELVDTAKTYDEFVKVYNNIVNENYDKISFTALRGRIEKVLDNGIFKTVIADTVKDIVLKFDEINIEGLEIPQVAKDIFTDLQTSFKQANFDASAYLKHDIMNLVDVADSLFSSGLFKDFKALGETASSFDMLNVVTDYSTAVSNMIKKVFDMNIVSDAFDTVGKLASDELQKAFEGKDVVIKLNTNIEDKDAFVDEAIVVLSDFVELSKTLNLPELIEAEDIVATLAKNTKLEEGLENAGEVFEKIRNLELLVIPAEEGQDEIYVFDNLMKAVGFEVLGDTVQVYDKQTKQVKTETLDTYTKFFNYIKTPVVNAQEMGLLDYENFDTLVDELVVCLHIDEALLADTILPLKYLTAFDLNTLVYDNVMNLLKENTANILDFTELDATEDLKVWHEEFVVLGKTLKNLYSGNVEGKTYLKFLLSDTYNKDTDFDKLLKALANDKNFEEIFEPIFNSSLFKGLCKTIITNIDDSVAELTGFNPNTEVEKIKLAGTAKDMQTLLQTILNFHDMSKLSMEEVGQILSVLQANAKAEGLFDRVFANIIWYMTGEELLPNTAGTTAHADCEKVKAYLGAETKADYFDVNKINFVEKFKTIDIAIKMGSKLVEGVKDILPTDEATAQQFVDSIKEVVDEYTLQEVNVAEVLTDLSNFIDGAELKKNLQEGTDEIISEKIDANFDVEVADALKNLLGLTTVVAG